MSNKVKHLVKVNADNVLAVVDFQTYRDHCRARRKKDCSCARMSGIVRCGVKTCPNVWRKCNEE